MEREEIDRLVRMILAVDPTQDQYDVRHQQIKVVEEWLERNTTQPPISAEEFWKEYSQTTRLETDEKLFSFKYTMEFAEAFTNQQKQVSERLYVECPNCNGMGYITDIKSTTNQHYCKKCNGSRYVLKEYKLTK